MPLIYPWVLVISKSRHFVPLWVSKIQIKQSKQCQNQFSRAPKHEHYCCKRQSPSKGCNTKT